MTEHIFYKVLSKEEPALLRDLIDLYATAFETENFKQPTNERLNYLLSTNNIIFCVALFDTKVVGGLTAYILPSIYNDSSQIYLYDLGVMEIMQRKGVGKGLISFLNEYCARMGYSEMYVQANAEDIAAIEFYKATGAQSENVVHFNYNLQNKIF